MLPCFAYGSNLDDEDWRAWCARHGHEAALRPLERAWLPDRVLRFSYRSPVREGGCLDVLPLPGQLAAGLLCEVDEAALAALDAKEGAPHRYWRVRVQVLDARGEVRDACTYEATEAWRLPYAAPAPGYLEAVLRGRRARGVEDEGQLLAAAADAPPPPAVAGLFVYGTLRPGGARHDLLAPHVAGPARPASTPGLLLDCGAWPGLRPPRGAVDQVRGELVAVHDLPAALAALDDYEGFRGWGDPGNLFQRTVVPVTLADGAVARAWAWRLAAPRAAPVIAGGDWLRHRGDGGACNPRPEPP